MTDLFLALLAFPPLFAALAYPAYVARLLWFSLRTW